jgi:hypothetical protein
MTWVKTKFKGTKIEGAWRKTTIRQIIQHLLAFGRNIQDQQDCMQLIKYNREKNNHIVEREYKY